MVKDLKPPIRWLRSYRGDEVAPRKGRPVHGGVILAQQPEALASDDVALYLAEAPLDAEVVGDDKHDRFLWLLLDQALPKCLPSVVASGLANAAAWIDGRSAAI